MGSGSGGGRLVVTASQRRHGTHAETLARGASALRSLTAIHTDTSPLSLRKWQAAVPQGGECILVDEPLGLLSFCLGLIAYKSSPHPTDPPKSQVLKKAAR